MRWWLGLPTLLAGTVAGCSTSAHAPASPTSTPPDLASPTARPSTGPSTSPSAAAKPTWTPVTAPLPGYSQEPLGAGKYQLTNNLTEEFVEVSAGGVRTLCPPAGRARCAQYLLVEVTQYSGNTQVDVSQRQFTLMSGKGVRYTPATGRQAARAAQPNQLLPTTVLQPDDDTDFVSGTVVFPVPAGAGRFSLLWRGHHAATLVKTAQGKVYATR